MRKKFSLESTEDILKNVREFDFNNPMQVAKWLRKGDFDELTKQLVMLFQCCSDIFVDGVVGLETYTTLNDYFSEPDKLEEFKLRLGACKEKCKQVLLGLSVGGETQIPTFPPKVRLTTVPTLLPKEVFNRILERLESRAIEQLSQEITETRSEEIILEKEFLRGIGLNDNDINIFDKLFKDSFQEELNYSQEFFNSKFKKHLSNLIDDLVGVSYNKFYLVESIASVVAKMLFPLAQFRNWNYEDVIIKGLEKFEELFSDKHPSKKIIETQIANILGKELDDEIKIDNEIKAEITYDLAKQVVEEVMRSVTFEIKLTVAEKNYNEKVKKIIMRMNLIFLCGYYFY